MMAFHDCLIFTLQQEGGFVDDPRDPGGATDHGITLAAWNAYTAHPATVDGLKLITDAQETAFYGAMYWNPVMGDALPTGVDLMVFDHGVNCGIFAAATLLQRVVGVTVDGHIGPLTLSATAKKPLGQIINDLDAAQSVYYRGLSGFATFGPGWMGRLSRRYKAANRMIGVIST